MNAGKVKSLAQMFAGFPAFQPSALRLKETIGTYLDVLTIYSEEQVAEACARLTREAREFPPTAGEVRAMCEKVVLATTPRRLALADESRPFANDLTDEQRAANVAKLKALLGELRATNMRNVPEDAYKRPARPAPFNFGPSLVNKLVETGLMKVKVEEMGDVNKDDDGPAF